MEKKEIEKLINKLNKLSDNPIKNLNKMKEIAHILTTHYLGKTKKKED